MKEKVLISGGTGLVGKKLTTLLLDAGYEIGILTRGKSKKEGAISYFHWNIADREIDNDAFKNVSYIVNLAGAGVAEQKWTDKRKAAIMDSRKNSTVLLFEKVKLNNIKLKAFISASAVGIYGNFAGDELKTETSPEADDFLAKVVVEWERAAKKFESLDIRTVYLRIGVVLDDEGGALEKIAKPIRYLAGAPLGSGDQYMSWVHNDDLCRMFQWAIENDKVSGIFNAVNPDPVSNAVFTKSVAKIIKKPLWLPNVPSFVLKLMLGEMSSIVLGGVRVSSKKLTEYGFSHQYDNLEEALGNLMIK